MRARPARERRMRRRIDGGELTGRGDGRGADGAVVERPALQDIDIERRTRFGLVNLERYAADNRIRHSCLRKNTGERQESRTLRTFHLTSQPEPLAIQDESFFKSFRHHAYHHTTSAVW